jgi:hypothetical protein
MVVDEETAMDRGRCAHVCSDPTIRRLLHVLLGNSRQRGGVGNSRRRGLLGNSRRRGFVCNSGRREITRSVCTRPRGNIRHRRQRVHANLHHDDSSGSEGDRQ